VTRCIGCQACSQACKESHGFEGTGEETELDATTYTVLLDKGDDRYLRRLCMHCADPSCASACPVGAFTKTELGPVVYDGSKCLGCRYCIVACPFNVPRYEWSKPVPVVRKCDGCYERQQQGRINACAEACPAEATTAGTREELLAEAHRRIAESPDTYYPHVYGEHEVGGTNVLVLSPVPFEELGMKMGLGNEPLPEPHLGGPVEDPGGRGAASWASRPSTGSPTGAKKSPPPSTARRSDAHVDVQAARPLQLLLTPIRPGDRFRRVLDVPVRRDPRRGRGRHRPPLLEGAGRVTNLSDSSPGACGSASTSCAGSGSPPAASRSRRRLRLQPQALQADRAPHVLTALLGYILVAVGLMYDLGKPWNIWHPIIMWNPRSPMFEVGWCVMLYLTVLALEFSGVVFEKLGWKRAARCSTRPPCPS
jgi:formate dehydrogenase iron-sulfur subunit